MYCLMMVVLLCVCVDSCEDLVYDGSVALCVDSCEDLL